ncbi:MAG: hypothetical protein C5B54_01055 [Acidobacteria bacterium]|nr:MAG: hypothetical protein C5B54_01055 [Acidobacteriota bacterium]
MRASETSLLATDPKRPARNSAYIRTAPVVNDTTSIYLAKAIYSNYHLIVSSARVNWKRIAPWSLAGLASLTGIFAVANVATSFFIQQTLIRPKRRYNKTSDLSGFIPEAIYNTKSLLFSAADGCKISACLLTPENPNGNAVVVCHGVSHDKNSAVRFVQYLLKAGYTLLLIDFRCHGDSGGDIITYGLREKDDLLAAVRYLRDPVGIVGGIGVLGASMGASIAIQAAAASDEIDALVLDSPFASLKKITQETVARLTNLPGVLLIVPLNLAFLWIRLFHKFNVPSVEPAKSVESVRCPILMIHGTRDTRIPVHHAIDIYEKAKEPKELWIVENVGHLGAYMMRPQEYKERVLDFFRQNLERKPRISQPGTAAD